MSIADYKYSIRKIIDSVNDESLLRYWKTQLERDINADDDGPTLSYKEWLQVEEGLADYKNGKVISMEKFPGKR